VLSLPGLREKLSESIPVAYLPQTSPDRLRGTWREARPERIAAALAVALARPTGGWLVAAASTDLTADRSLSRTVAGRDLVLWRDEDGSALAGSAACPHLGADLGGCDVVGGQMLCSWHGLPLGRRTSPPWASVAAYDDGVLVWVRAGEVESGAHSLAGPVLPIRPDLATSIVSVVSLSTTCEPRDIIANRLDPWHGAWLHPYAFSDLTVDEAASSDERLVLDVAYRLGRRLAVPVRAEFTCPDSHTIVMTITDGEGTGSVVETHATPLTGPGSHPARTVMTEAVVATSERVGFAVARRAARLVRVCMRASATRLWTDDLAYAFRLYEMRQRASIRGEAYSLAADPTRVT
jgi:phenylpropionate dioxygenase-like ring-hydroxylating dioxygenase large terminal subunit